MDFIATLTTIRHNGADCRALIIADPKKQKPLAEIPDGVRISSSISLKRDPDKHKNFFCMIATFVRQRPEGFTHDGIFYKFSDDEAGRYACRQWVKRILGFVNRVYWTEGEEVKCKIEERSLEMDKCSAKSFMEIYCGMRDLLAGILGIDGWQLETNSFEGEV